MATPAQIRANQQNAKKSTGPRTDQGKQRSSRNAIKHGLRATHPVIPGENTVDYQRKLDQLRADLRPRNTLEDELVEQIADTAWRLRRYSHIEAAVETDYIDEAANEEHNAGNDDRHILGDALTHYGRIEKLATLGRYESQLSRRFHRAIKELRDLRKTRADTLFVERRYENREQQRAQRPQPEATQPNDAADPPVAPAAQSTLRETAEQTQSITTLLESIVSEPTPAPNPGSNTNPILEFHRTNPRTSGQTGRQEDQS